MTTNNNGLPSNNERILSPHPFELEAAQASPFAVEDLSRIINQLFDENTQNPLLTVTGRVENEPVEIPVN